jgi:AraC family transcriptional regulator
MCPELNPGQFHGLIQAKQEVGDLFFAITSRARGVAVPPHVHTHGTFLTLLSGRHHWVEGSGKIRWSVPGVWYYLAPDRVQEHAPARTPIVGLGIHFDPNLYGVEERFTSDLMLESDAGRRVASTLPDELRNPGASTEFLLQSAFFELLAGFIRTEEADANLEPPKWLDSVKLMLDANFRQSLTLQSVASQVGMHPAHLARTFRRQFGMSVGEYIRDRRLEWSYKRLMSAEYKLAEIALAAGFADHAHFSRAFRSRYGMTPSECRTRIRAEA